MYTSTTRLVGSAIQPALSLLSSALAPAKPAPHPTRYPTAPPPSPLPTPLPDLEAALAGLATASKAWARTDLKARAALLRRTMATTREVRERWRGMEGKR